MKVIDLLNKIANGEEVPPKIKVNGCEYKESNGQFWCDEIEMYLIDNCTSIYNLNDEVEIIEEDEKIEKLFNCEIESKNGEINMLVANINDLKDKINEIIDYINNGDKE